MHCGRIHLIPLGLWLLNSFFPHGHCSRSAGCTRCSYRSPAGMLRRLCQENDSGPSNSGNSKQRPILWYIKGLIDG
ncbi:hypothetical protein EMPG_15059 [Blastomyces silverae]|uniref:Secreted protein n=1 Tax=Blastomyces silverae TaxID=2060906 RepID=A0A0H1BEH8_9EURO|nr:hypothetical protein EMPG_15059 [Blastomyces silverae]